MELFLMLLTTAMVPVWYIWPSRIVSMTFKSSGWSVTIKNDKLARMLIAEKNTWGTATFRGKRNKMSLWGVISYLLFLPQVPFLIYNWWIYVQTGSGKWCEAEISYLSIVMLYNVIGLSIKIREGVRYHRGEIW